MSIAKRPETTPAPELASAIRVLETEARALKELAGFSTSASSMP